MDNGMKRLMRSRANKMICGVCGGIGEYLNIDPTLVRLIWALCSAASVGMGLIVYIVAAVVIPEDDGIIG
ncbi:MAG: PspC domain-containing protein [Lachnospiraceae bacterium]|nr:PspC domain-containing protein [Lachnospiraceae bacterium]